MSWRQLEPKQPSGSFLKGNPTEDKSGIENVANAFIYEPVTKGRDLKWDTLPQNQTPSKLFSVLPLESGMFQVTISIIKKWF